MNEHGVTRLPPTPCPNCKQELDAAGRASGEDATPEPGDITACLKCGHPMVFTETMGMRSMTEAEWLALPEDARRQLIAVRIFAEHIVPARKAQWN